MLYDETVSDKRIARAQLRSPRGADSINLQVPVDSMAAIAVADYTFPVNPEGNANGYYTFQCRGQVCDGLVLELHLNRETPIEVLITDITYGLPPGGETFLQARPVTRWRHGRVLRVLVHSFTQTSHFLLQLLQRGQQTQHKLTHRFRRCLPVLIRNAWWRLSCSSLQYAYFWRRCL